MDPSLLALALLAAILLRAAFVAARRVRRDRERLDAEGLLAEGEVLEVWQDGPAFRVRYRYLPAGAAEPVLRNEMASCLRVLVPEVGQKVRVRYDPRDPRRSRIVGEGE